MSIVVKETRRSRSRTLDSRELEYIAWGSNDPAAIETAITAVLPTSIDGLIVTAYTQRPRDDDDSVFDATVSYGQAPQDGAPELSFELSMQTSHVTQSLERVHAYGTGAPNLPGIGFSSKDGKYEGTDIQIPVFTWRESVTRSRASVDNAFLGQLMTCASNPVNSATFRGFAIGEVMFLGASGGQKGADKMSIAYAFAGSPNLTGLSIGSITGIAKKGWEYLWALYESNADDTNKFLVELPRAVYIERMYNTSNFATLLGI